MRKNFSTETLTRLQLTKDNENPLPFKGRDRVGMGLFSSERLAIACMIAIILTGCGTSGPDKGDDINNSNTVIVPSPSAPKRLTLSTGTDGITLSWIDTTGEDGFRIVRDGNIIETLPANVTEWKDASVTDGITYCYLISAFNKGGATFSNKKCVTFSFLNKVPQVWVEYPSAGELVYKLTRVQIKWEYAGDGYLGLRISINNEEQLNEEVKSLSDSLPKWFEVDFTGFHDGAYAILAEVYNLNGAVATEEVPVHIDNLEVEMKAIEFLYEHSSIGSLGLRKQVVRWPSIPIQIEVSPWFTSGEFQIIEDAANTLSRHTGIPFKLSWSGIETLNIYTCDSLPSWFDLYAIYIYPHTPSKMASGTSAATCVKRDPPTHINSAIIEVDPDFLTGSVSSPEKIEALIAHEIGHALPVFQHETEDYLMKFGCVYPCYRLSPAMIRAMEKLYFEMRPGDLVSPP